MQPTLPWQRTHKFANAAAARVLAHEAARLLPHGERISHLVAVCKVISWLVPKTEDEGEENEQRCNLVVGNATSGGCKMQMRLGLGFCTARGPAKACLQKCVVDVCADADEDAVGGVGDDDKMPIHVVNLDRFFIPHPCVTLWSALKRESSTCIPYGCERCRCSNEKQCAGDKGVEEPVEASPLASLSLCVKCFQYLLYEVLSAPRHRADFGSLDYWAQEHRSSSCGIAATLASRTSTFPTVPAEARGNGGDEWFLSWTDLRKPLDAILAAYLSAPMASDGGGNLRRVALVPGNGRSVVAKELAELEEETEETQTRESAAEATMAAATRTRTRTRTRRKVFDEVIATDAAPGITESMILTVQEEHKGAVCRNSTMVGAGVSLPSFLPSKPHCSVNKARVIYLFDDIRQSSLLSNSVDFILDKGCLDALACSFYEDGDGTGGAIPTTERKAHSYGTRDERRAAREYGRLLRDSGLLVINTGRSSASALAPFLRGRDIDVGCHEWELLEKRRFVATLRAVPSRLPLSKKKEVGRSRTQSQGGKPAAVANKKTVPTINPAIKEDKTENGGVSSGCLLCVLRLHRHEH